MYNHDHDHDPHAGHVMPGARPPRSPDTGEHGSEHSGGHAGHGDHAAVFRDRFWVSLALAVPVVFSSHMVGGLLGYHVPSWATWMAPVVGTVLFFYGGWSFLTGAVGELRARRPGMMTLVAMAITVAAVASALTTLGVSGLMLDFWWELALLVVIMLLGHWLEMRAGPGPWSRWGPCDRWHDLRVLREPDRVVEAAGYTAALPRPAAATDEGEHQEVQDSTRALRDRLITSAVLSVPIIAMAMIPALQFTYWQWISLAPGRSWAGRRGRSTARPGPTCATARPPGTPSSRSACSPRSAGRCGHCCSAPRASRV